MSPASSDGDLPKPKKTADDDDPASVNGGTNGLAEKLPSDGLPKPKKTKDGDDPASVNGGTNGLAEKLPSDGDASSLLLEGKGLSVDGKSTRKPASMNDGTNGLAENPSNEGKKSTSLPQDVGVGKVERPKPTFRYVREHMHLIDPDDPIFYTWGMRSEIAFGMCVVSLMYAVIAPCLLLGAAGHMLDLVWTVSLITCSYMYLWIISLSETMGKMTAFIGISYCALLAFAAAHLITPVTGMAIVYLDMVYTTWMFGHAIAEHRQRTGSEQSTRAVVTPDLSKEEQKRRDEWFYYVCFHFGSLSLFVFVRTVWMVVLGRVDMAYSVVGDLSLGTWAICCMWSIFVASTLLEGAFASMFIIYKITGYYVALYILSVLLNMFVDNTVGMLVLLFSPMAMVGFFGYSVAVHARYKLRGTASSNTSS